VASVLSDAKLPTVQAATPAEIVRLWKYTFCRDCLEPLLHRVFVVARPSFSVTLELDQMLRSHPTPQALQYRGISPVDTEPEYSALTVQRVYLTMVKQSGLWRPHGVCEVRADTWPSHAITSSLVVRVYDTQVFDRSAVQPLRGLGHRVLSQCDCAPGCGVRGVRGHTASYDPPSLYLLPGLHCGGERSVEHTS
jgi:hypothetical protein